MVKSFSRGILRNLVVIVLLITIYTLLVTVSYCFDKSLIADHVNQSLALLDSEGKYPMLPFDNLESRRDNFTDEVMLNQMLSSSDSALSSAMVTYPSYWHGYSIFLRPLLIVFNLSSIRYLNVYIFSFALLFTLWEMCKRTNIMTVAVFLLLIVTGYFFLAPINMQYLSTTLILLLSCCYILRHDNMSVSSIGTFFLIVGSLTNFFDLLTFPLLTLGVSLGLFLILKSNRTTTLKSNLFLVFLCTVTWFVGFGVTWIAKWVISSTITHNNIFDTISERIQFRMYGNEEVPLDRLFAYEYNLKLMFRTDTLLPFAFLLLVLTSVFIKHHKSKGSIIANFAFIPLALYPYIWYFILANHSQIHFWFTYRIQVVTIFSVVGFFISSIDWKQYRSYIESRKIN